MRRVSSTTKFDNEYGLPPNGNQKPSQSIKRRPASKSYKVYSQPANTKSLTRLAPAAQTLITESHPYVLPTQTLNRSVEKLDLLVRDYLSRKKSEQDLSSTNPYAVQIKRSRPRAVFTMSKPADISRQQKPKCSQKASLKIIRQTSVVDISTKKMQGSTESGVRTDVFPVSQLTTTLSIDNRSP